jgi:tetratricopeptide (TPR) repeat protein
MRTHFESLPVQENWNRISTIEDLTPAIELYNTLIGLGRYDEAEFLFYERISRLLFYRLGASRQQSELLEMLFPEGVDQLPRISRPDMQAYALNALALAYDASGHLKRTAQLYTRQIALQEKLGNLMSVGIAYCNMSNALQMLGSLNEAEAAARHSLMITRDLKDVNSEAISLYAFGTALLVRGFTEESDAALQRALRIRSAQRDLQSEGIINAQLAQQLLWKGDYAGSVSLAKRAWELAGVQLIERDFIKAGRLQGTIALMLNDYGMAAERLQHALTRARAINLAEEEIPALIAFAELSRRQKGFGSAREFLDDVWDLAERGPYPLFHADAFNVLAQLERDEGNTAGAIEAATKAYRLAWCDGPPFAYHWGLEKAKQHLRELGAPEPKMPSFDQLKFEPMPEVEINPRDEFYANEKSIAS